MSRLCGMLGVVVPAIVTTFGLWVPLAVLLVASAVTDRGITWESGRPPRPGWADAAFAVALAVSGLGAVLTNAALPAGESVIWPLAAMGMMAGAIGLRRQAMRQLGRYFDGDLRTEPGQVLVDTGPYRWVRHPGYLANTAYVAGLALLFAYWPPLLVAVGAMVGCYRTRIAREEALNSAGIVGYDDYLRRRRWRMVPLIW